MSGAAVIRYLIASNAPVLAVVPAERIIVAPQMRVKITLPAINVRKVSGGEDLTVAMGTGRLRSERVQVTAFAHDYASVVDLLELVRTACVAQQGEINSIDVDSVLPAGEGPDLSDQDAGIYEQSRDFMVRWAP